MNIEAPSIAIFVTYEIGSGGAGYACAEYLNEFDSQGIKTALIYQNGVVPFGYKGDIHQIKNIKIRNFNHKIKKVIFRKFPHNPSKELISLGISWNHQKEIFKIIKNYSRNNFKINIYLHWINFGFLSLRNIYKISKIDNVKIIWQLHDLWPLQDLFHTPATYKTEEGLIKSWSIEGHPNILQIYLMKKSRQQKKKIYSVIKFSTSSQRLKQWLMNNSPYNSIITNENTIVMNFPAIRTINYCKSISKGKYSVHLIKPFIVIPSSHFYFDIRTNINATVNAYLESEISAIFDLKVIAYSDVQVEILNTSKGGNVTFLNNLKRVEFIHELSSASAVVIPSLFETYGLTILEALSINKIVGLQSTNTMNLNFKQIGFRYFSGDWTDPNTWSNFYLYYQDYHSKRNESGSKFKLDSQISVPILSLEDFVKE